MKINGEEVELVTSFESLRAGMIVWVRPCYWCTRPERAILLRKFSHRRLLPYPNEQPEIADGWERAPQGCRSNVVTRRSIAEHRLYRVVDPLLDARPVTRAKELVADEFTMHALPERHQ